MYRTVSKFGQKPFVLVQRKGWLMPKWEAVVTIPSCPEICPWTLLQKYVQLTAKAHGVPSGSPVFRALTPPHPPLKANSLGSLTKQALDALGVDTSVWKPHSTRGAGVTMFKRLVFPAERCAKSENGKMFLPSPALISAWVRRIKVIKRCGKWCTKFHHCAVRSQT